MEANSEMGELVLCNRRLACVARHIPGATTRTEPITLAWDLPEGEYNGERVVLTYAGLEFRLSAEWQWSGDKDELPDAIKRYVFVDRLDRGPVGTRAVHCLWETPGRGGSVRLQSGLVVDKETAEIISHVLRVAEEHQYCMEEFEQWKRQLEEDE